MESPDNFSTRRTQEEAFPEIQTSRAEYHLLQTAKEMGYRRTYLLIKTVVCLGIRTTEMAHLSVEGLTQETVRIPYWNKIRSIMVFDPIRAELLAYAAECGIKEGPISVTRDGQPMQHFLIWKEIKKVCRRLEFPEQKGTPKSLYQLYINTRNEVTKESAEEALMDAAQECSSRRYTAHHNREECEAVLDVGYPHGFGSNLTVLVG